MVVRWSEKQETSGQQSISGVIDNEPRQQFEEIYHSISLLFATFHQIP